MRNLLLALLLATSLSLADDVNIEGGNISYTDLGGQELTHYWSGIVGWMDPFSPSDPNLSISNQTVGPPDTFYLNYPNGTYYNESMIVVSDRISNKPYLSDVYSPAASDFNSTGMFSSFSAFSGLNFSTFSDSPLRTFADPLATAPCTIGAVTYSCAYIYLQNHSFLGVLKFDNGTHQEPVFVTNISTVLGYNGTYFDFQYMVPKEDHYLFYVYPEECEISVLIDGVPTDVFPKTAVPYDVEFLVTYENSTAPIDHAVVNVVETNGRNILYPNLYPGRDYVGRALMETNAAGNAVFALSPTRYNVPDPYGHEIYAEVTSPSYCRINLSIATYDSLTPTYRSSLVNPSYESQVKSSVQNMNQLATTASTWIYAGKYRGASVNVTTLGGVTGSPTLKAGAPNIFNITVTNGGVPVTANLTVQETDGFIIFVPLQPEKSLYNNTGPFPSNETFILIPTRYNNDANLTVFVEYGGSNIATLTFAVDSLLEPPTSSEPTMDTATNALIASALQNINQVLSNIGKSISTV
ncbi:hypothetical protein GF412_01885 [Candidatus Micrarchaeota archaeon]|nr:hypothetical protein [Candidatus Micrarchaeota archaeon]MBD3417712.1 hypothetical protein [Candidatus Micrarchaeota archaeon]